MFSMSPVKEPRLQVPLTELPQRERERERERERDAPFLEPSFFHLSTPPLYAPPSWFPSGAPMEMIISRAFSTYLPRFPVMKSPHQVPLTELPQRRSTPRVPFIHLSKSLVNEPPSSFPSGAPVEKDSRLQSLFYITFRILRKGFPLQVPFTERPWRVMLRFQCPPTISQISR